MGKLHFTSINLETMASGGKEKIRKGKRSKMSPQEKRAEVSACVCIRRSRREAVG